MRSLTRKLLFFAILFVLFATAPSFAHAPELFTLDNGLSVILWENHSADVVALQIWIKAGSCYESEKEAGIAHVIEHMLFKETKRRRVGEIPAAIESVGGRINAFTSFDHTVLHAVLPSSELETGLDILSDVIMNTIIDEKELKKELEVILEELSRGEDRPFGKLSKEFFQQAYRVHPLRRPVIGYRRTIMNFRPSDLLRFMNKWYKPSHMTLIVAGDFDPAKARASIEKYFSSMSAGPPVKIELPAEPEQKKMRFLLIEGDIAKSYAILGWHIPSARDPNIHIIDALATILGQGESSRLSRKIKEEKQLAISISAYSFTLSFPGLLTIYIVAEPEKLLDAIGETLKETYLLKYEPVSGEELEKAKTILESDFIYAQETMEGQARTLGYFFTLTGSIDFWKTYVEKVRLLREADIVGAARKYLKNENLTISIYQPKGRVVPKESEMIQAAENAEKRAAEAETAKEYKGEILKKTLKNGMTIIVKENRSVPTLAARAVFLGGLRFENKNNNGINHLLARMLTKGTKCHTAEELATEIDQMAASIEGFSGRNSIGLEGKFIKRFVRKGLDLFFEILLNPAFDPNELEKEKNLIISEISSKKDNLETLAFEEFNKLLYKVHPYGMPVEGTQETIRSLTREDLINYYSRIVVPSNCVLAIVGDVDAAKIAREIEEKTSKWHGNGFSAPAVPQEPDVESPRRKEIIRERKQAHIVLGFKGTNFFSKDRYALDVLDAVLSGMGGRLFIDLRDKESLAYSLTSVNFPGLDDGFFAFYAAAHPEKINRIIEGMKKEIERLKAEPVSEDELRRAKEYIIGSRQTSLQDNASQATELAFDQRYGLGIDFVRKYINRIESVTGEDILKAARKYLDMKRAVLVIIGPQR